MHRTLLSTLCNERGLLVLTDQCVVYIPDCEIALGRDGILDNQQVMQYKQAATRSVPESVLRLFYQTVSPLHEHRTR